MCCTVCKSGPRGRQCNVLFANLAPGGANVLYCLPICFPRAPIRGRCAGARVCGCAGAGRGGWGGGDFRQGKHEIGIGTKLGAPMRCTVCKSGPRGATNLLQCLQIWPPEGGGANVLHCLQIWPSGAPMCCTVCKFGPRGGGRQSAVLSANLAPGGAPMCCAVCKSGPRGGDNVLHCLQIWPRGRQCTVLSANLASEGAHLGPVCGCAGVRVPGGGGGGGGRRFQARKTQK